MMEFVKEERDAESYTITEEDTEEQTGVIGEAEEGQEHSEDERRFHYFMSEELPLSFSQTDESFPQEGTNAIRPFACHICGKTFSREVNLNVHIKIHAGERPYLCPQCGKSLKSKQSLNNHLRIHTGDYTCPQCNKSFSSNSDLKVHIRVHTGEKPYTCPQCDKSFTKRGNLLYHIRIHTGEKPYSCHLCDKSFTHGQNLKVHLWWHSKGRVVPKSDKK